MRNSSPLFILVLSLVIGLALMLPGTAQAAPDNLNILANSNNQITATNTAVPTGLWVQLRDGTTGVGGQTLTYTVIPGPGGAGATLSSTTAVTRASDGYAFVNATANGIAGTYTISVSYGGVAPVYITLTNRAPTALSIHSGNNQSVLINTPFTALWACLKDSAGDAVPNQTLTFTVNLSGSAGATPASGTATTQANNGGCASFTPTANATAGTYTVTVSYPGVAPINFTLTNTAPASAVLVLGSPGSQNQTTAVNTAFANALWVCLQDGSGGGIANATLIFTPPASGAGAVLSTPAPTRAGDGCTSVTATANAIAGSYAVVVSYPGVTPFNFNLTNAGAPDSLYILPSSNNQSATINTAFGNALWVRLLSGADGVPDATLTYTVIPGPGGAGAVLSAGTAVTRASDGYAFVNATANGIVGTYTISVSYPGVTSVNITLTNTTGAPANLSISGGDNQSAEVSTAFANSLVACVSDAGGNPVSGTTISFTAPVTGPSATLSAPSAVTDASGCASVTATANASAGSYTVEASAGALNASFNLTNTPAPGSPTLTVTGGDNQSAQVSTAFALPLRVRLLDGSGDPDVGVTVTFTVPATGAGVTLSATTAVTDADGYAEVTATANASAGSYTVEASAGALNASFNLTNTAASTGGGGNGTTSPTAPLMVTPPPPPPAPRALDVNFDSQSSLRVVASMDQFDAHFRMLVEHGEYIQWLGGAITGAGNIGIDWINRLGVWQAVDVFSASGQARFKGDVVVCLQGTGSLLFLNARFSPRQVELMTPWTTPSFPGYTCGTVYEPGTVILVKGEVRPGE